MPHLPDDADPSPSMDLTPVQTSEQLAVSRNMSLLAESVPATVPGYEVQRCLGEGSFGSVWLGREKKTGRQVAIKFFTNRRGLDWTLLTREVEKLAVLDSSRDVVRLLDVGWDHEPPYFVMEYLPQQSVATLLEVGPLPVEQAIEITRAVARALVHSHGAGILHCDIKPGNVLIDRGGEARLADFGQSRLSSDQSPALGTFYYMAPEQAALDAVPDVRWDVYATGALLFQMVTGDPPFRTDDNEQQLRTATSLQERLEIYRDIIESSPPPAEHRSMPGVDTALAELIDCCLKRDPAERLPSPQRILDRLDQRERKRTQLPLIWLGFLGPVLFLLILTWIASQAVPETVREAESQLLSRSLGSDMATANLLAAGIQQELSERLTELERIARRLPSNDPDEGFLGFRADLFTVLDNWRHETDTRLERQNRTLDESVFLTDKSGIQIFRSPWSESIGKTFSYRDYFHSLGRELTPGRDDVTNIKPRTEPGISLAFRSTNTNQFMVAIAVPVWARDGSEVIGILARTIHLTDLLNQWESLINIEKNGAPKAGLSGESPSRQESGNGAPPGSSDSPFLNDRFIALVDMREARPYLLDHHWMTQEHLSDLKDEVQLKKILELTPEEEFTIRQAARSGSGIANYRDPLADDVPDYEGQWLAAVTSVENIDWIAIVQERRSEAVAPMAILNWMFLRYGLIALSVFAAVLVLLWWLIRRVAQN